MISDVLAGIDAGCRSILIGSDEPRSGRVETEGAQGRTFMAGDFVAAAEMILD